MAAGGTRWWEPNPGIQEKNTEKKERKKRGMGLVSENQWRDLHLPRIEKKDKEENSKNTLQKENKTKISSAAILPWRGEIGSKEERGLQKKKEIREGDRGSD